MTDWTSPDIVRQNAVASNQLLHALLGLYCWEWVVSLDFDIAMICGKRKFRWPMILYLLDRYGMLTGLICLTVLYNPPVERNCKLGFRIAAFFGCTSLSLSSIMLAMRTMAVWNRDRRVVIPLSILGSVQLVLCFFSGVSGSTTWDIQLGCVVTSYVSPGPEILYGYTLGFDLLILVLIGWKLWTPALYEARIRHQTKGVAAVLFKDGLIYFAIACAVNIIALILSILNLNPVMSLIADPQASTITTIAACRVVRRLVLYNEQANDYFSDMIPNISINEPTAVRRSTVPTGAVDVELITFRHMRGQPSDDERRHSDGIHTNTLEVTIRPSVTHKRL